MNTVEYFEMRQREVEEQLEAIESGRVLRENLRRINSSQK
jgi:hypothetical protein